MRLEFLEAGPALLAAGSMRVLAVADLHLGIESDLSRRGLHFRSRTDERKERVIACIRESDPDLLVLLGDVKHSVPLATRQEFREIPGVLDAFRKEVPLRVLPGNHDPGIERFLGDGELLPREGAAIDGVGYLHGHTYPDPSLEGLLLLAGHHHPTVTLTDEVGCSLRAPACLLAGLEGDCIFPGRQGCSGETRVLFVPACNELAGYDIQRTVAEPFSPLSRCMRAGDAEVFLADGTFIGPLSALGEHEGD
jgi:hypothetical protein